MEIKAVGQAQEFLGKKELIDPRQRNSLGNSHLEAKPPQRPHSHPILGSPFSRNRSLGTGSERSLFPSSRKWGKTDESLEPSLREKRLESHLRTGGHFPKEILRYININNVTK